MVRVLVVISTSFVEYGGLTTVAMNYYRNMSKDGIQIDFASTNEISCNLKKELTLNGSQYYKLPKRGKNIIPYYLALKTLARNYNVMHVHANSATAAIELLAGKQANVPNRIIHIHNTSTSHWFLHRMLKPVFNCSYTHAIACSRAAGDWIFGEGNFLILNNAIETKKYEYNALKRKKIRDAYNITSDTLVLGHVGKINEQKNHRFLIELFDMYQKIIQKTKLLIVGDGELRNGIEYIVKEKGLTDKIIFAGMQNDIQAYLSAFDLFVFPSKWEGLPLSVIEALACGLKCYISDRITNEINITGNVKFLSINNGVNIWVQHIKTCGIYDRLKEQENNVVYLKKNGYDITLSSEMLRKLYTNSIL